MQNKKLVVIGGGAAGFFCAINAARLHPSLSVIIIEKSNKLLSKVKISGGGRCNVTHACFSIAELIKRYPRGAAFLKKAFHQFNTQHTIEWFEARGVKLVTEPDGRMFPATNTSQTIIDCLLEEANRHEVSIHMNTSIERIDHEIGSGFQLHVKNGRSIQADYVCIASGGYPSAAQFKWIERLGHAIVPPVPSLFTFNMPRHPITALMGITVPAVSVKIVGTKWQQQGPLLITHWGFSGPAILKLSAWAARELSEKNYTYQIAVNWLPAYNEQTVAEQLRVYRFSLAAQKIHNRNPFGLPARLWEFLLQQAEVSPDLRWADLPAKEQNKLVKLLCTHSFDIQGKTTFKEEFVTAGGLSLQEIDANTLESKKVPGLFFAGEVLDVDGVTGGFNFQNAWTTGWIAAQSIASAASIQ